MLDEDKCLGLTCPVVEGKWQAKFGIAPADMTDYDPDEKNMHKRSTCTSMQCASICA